jgi:hypothetical protein
VAPGKHGGPGPTSVLRAGTAAGPGCPDRTDREFYGRVADSTAGNGVVL